MATKTEEQEPAARVGRPRTMEEPKTVTVVLDRVHRDLIDVHMRQHEIASASEAVRDIIERHFNLGARS